jgi:signal transduction histidine kinase/DNA-binding response OmpR family regulator
MNDKPVVLVVDDRPENLLAAEAVLESLDVTLETAVRAESALQFLLEHDVAVILLDVEMPDIDGFETARLIRQRPRSQDTPIIFVTALERGNAAVREGYELGCVDYIIKPFQPDILRWKVSVLVELYRSRQKEKLLIEEQTRRLAMEGNLRRTRLLADVSGTLASSMNQATVLERLPQRLVPHFADRAIVFKREGDNTIRPYSSAGADSFPLLEKEGWPEGPGWSIRQSPAVIDDFIQASCAFIPIQCREEIIGTLALYRRKPQRFDSTEKLFLAELRDRIALSLANIALYEESERANRAKNEFLAVVSHELRTPLVTITGWANILLSKRLPPERVEAALQTIQRSARLQNDLITDILDFSRIDTGKLSMNLQAVDLKTLLDETIDALRPLAEEKGIAMVQQLGEADAPVDGDPKRLQQLFSNLLSNAVKFTPADGQVTVGLTKVDDRIRVDIKDTGIGIEPEFLPHVFEPFVQADSSNTRSYSGLGLGLAIALRLVEMHGGEIRVESAGRGQGSTFTIDLPERSEQVRAS